MNVEDKELKALNDLKLSLQEKLETMMRTHIVPIRKAIESLDNTINYLRGGGEEIEAATKLHQADKPKPKKRSPPVYLSMRDIQTALVKFSVDIDRPFTTWEAMQYLIKTGVIPRITSRNTMHVRHILSDTLLFSRTGERNETRWEAQRTNHA